MRISLRGLEAAYSTDSGISLDTSQVSVAAPPAGFTAGLTLPLMQDTGTAATNAAFQLGTADQLAAEVCSWPQTYSASIGGCSNPTWVYWIATATALGFLAVFAGGGSRKGRR